MDEPDMDRLLEFYAPATVPKFKDVRGVDPAEEHMDDEGIVWRFDGSFGWW